MEIDILDSLDLLGYDGELCEEKALKEALALGPKSINFTRLVSWLTKELQAILQLEGVINAVEDASESGIFLLETSSFLKEMCCPYDVLMDGSVSQRLDDVKSRCLLLTFLCSELQAARILECRKKEKQLHSSSIQMDASPIATSLTKMSGALGIKVVNIESPQEFFLKLYGIVNGLISSHPDSLQPPIVKAELSKTQWELFRVEILKDMHSDYKTRRQMLLTRLDVTIQSFKWSERFKGKEAQISAKYLPRRSFLKEEPAVGISDLLAAREDITIFEKTSGAGLIQNTKSSVNRVVIGKVPDRGGRPKEQRPPVEMPDWQKRTQDTSQRNDNQGQRGGRNPHYQQFSGPRGGKSSMYSNKQGQY